MIDDIMRRYEDQYIKMQETLEEFAAQKLIGEMTDEEHENADFDGAYETFIEKAREALK